MKTLSRVLKSRSGMTVVEMMLAILLLAIIGATVAASLAPTLRAYNNANSVAEINTLLDNLSRDMLSDIAKAREISLSSTGEITIKNDLLTVSYGVDDEGYLYRDAKDSLILAKGYYKKKTISLRYLTMTRAPGGAGTLMTLAPGVYGKNSNLNIILEFSLYDDGGFMTSRSFAAKPLGLNQYDAKQESSALSETP